MDHSDARPAMLFPPELVPHLRSSLAGHSVLDGLSDGTVANLLTIVFFASLEAEEGEYLPIRVVFGGSQGDEPAQSTRWGILHWTFLSFDAPQPCSIRNMRRLSRATMQDWTLVHLASNAGHLQIVGLARRGFGTDNGAFLEIVAPVPGRLEVWSGRRRVVEYAQGNLIPPPENVILAEGPVQRALQRAAARAGVSTQAWPVYVEAFAAMVRAMAAHGHGGILAITDTSGVHIESGISTARRPSLLALLNQLVEPQLHDEASGAVAEPSSRQSEGVIKAALRSEIDRAALEIGGLTALDGATLLDSELSVRAFGVILPTLPHIDVMQGFNNQPSVLSPFSIAERGARHRAAAVLAHDHAENLVFVASTDGDVGCILREADSAHVVMWRFTGHAR